MTLRILFLLSVSSLAACARPAPAGTTPVVFVRATPTAGCEELGVVHGEGGGVFGHWQRNSKIVEEAREDAAAKARGLGATHVVMGPVELRERGGTATRASVVGQAYRCGARPAAETAPAPVSTAAADVAAAP